MGFISLRNANNIRQAHARVCVGKVLFKQNPLANRYKGDITKQEYFTMSRIVFKDMLSEFISLDKYLINQDNVENFSIYSWCTSTTKARTVVLNKKYIFIINIAIIMYVLMVRTLAKSSNLSNNTATTKHTSAQPSRHTLAIFMPNATHALSVFITSLLDACIIRLSAVYDGLIGVNTRPKGNSPSRMYAVVETHHPILGGALLTKHTGVFA